MHHELNLPSFLLTQALINPHAVKAAAERANPDDCEAPPSNAEVQASLAVGDLLALASCGMDVRWKAPLTLCAAAQHAADLHGDDTAEMSGFWSGEKPSEDHKQSDINRNTEYFDAHATAAERFSAALHDAMMRYSADIKHAESL